MSNGSSNDVWVGYDATDTPSIFTIDDASPAAPLPGAAFPMSLLVLGGGAVLVSRRRHQQLITSRRWGSGFVGITDG